MKLVSSLAGLGTSLLLRSPDEYDPLQIYQQETCSQKIRLLMMQSAISSVFIMDDSYLSASCDWLDLPSFTSDLSREPIPLHHLGLNVMY